MNAKPSQDAEPFLPGPPEERADLTPVLRAEDREDVYQGLLDDLRITASAPR